MRITLRIRLLARHASTPLQTYLIPTSANTGCGIVDCPLDLLPHPDRLGIFPRASQPRTSRFRICRETGPASPGSKLQPLHPRMMGPCSDPLESEARYHEKQASILLLVGGNSRVGPGLARPGFAGPPCPARRG